MPRPVPREARLELELPAGNDSSGVCVWDVSHLLPKRLHPRRADIRPEGQDIERLYTHHSGALGLPGFKGMLNSARYVVGQRDFPGFPYHFWFPYEPVVDPRGCLVIFRGHRDEYRAWHTGGRANDHGVAVCWQGDLRHKEPSPNQLELAEAFYPWAVQRYQLKRPDQLSFHSEADKYGGRKKPSCPGPHVENWLRRWRRELFATS